MNGLMTYPRSWIDMTNKEIVTLGFRLLNFSEAKNSSYAIEFERAFAKYVGTKEAVNFPYCRSAMLYSLMALDLNPGDEVILPAYTFWVDAAMIVLAGLRPVFVDVNFKTSNIEISQIENVITAKSRVIFPTHLNGLPSEMDKILNIAKKYNLRVIEDCARACGAKYKNKYVGTFDIGTFSFGFGKSFYGFGGAMVTSNDLTFIARLRELKKDFKNISLKDLYFQSVKGVILKYCHNPYLHKYTLYPKVYSCQVEGNKKYQSMFKVKMPPYAEIPSTFKVNMCNIQNHFGMNQLRRIEQTNRKRFENGVFLNTQLADLEKSKEIVLPAFPSDSFNVNVHYTLWSERAEELQIFLIKNGIDVQADTAIDVTTLERFHQYKGNFPNAKKLHGKTLFLPTHPYFTKKHLNFIATKVKEFFND